MHGMKREILRLFSALALGIVGSIVGCDPGTPSARRDAGDDTGPVSDADGDTISDEHEGAGENRDTDGDGTPDFLDDDSDGDGIPDVVEAGDDDPRTPPRDSDGDGLPDFVDLDADGNGIPDAEEIPGDVDGDGIENFADLDDDNDGIVDVQELAGMDVPVDTDGDGLADYQDADSDNDTILDGHERDFDTDMDGTPDLRDRDSDNDGIPDAGEAGDAELSTPPVDTDGDGIPDFRDLDSDNDGLSDADELAAGTSPTHEDTDGDGVPDLIEVGAGTDPTNAADSPRTRGDFVFLVPYEADPSPTRDTLTFRTSIQFADIYFLFDISGSMAGEITALRNTVTTIVDDLQCVDSGVACMRDSECGAGEICSPFSRTCIEDPGTSSCILSPWTGTGSYVHFLENRLSLQPDPAATSAAIRTSTTGSQERLYEAVYAVATGMGTASLSVSGCTGPAPGRIGCPSFREEAVRILVAFTDEYSYGDRITTLPMAVSALRDNNITFIGVWSAGPTHADRNDLVQLANMSGSVDRAGNPLVFNASVSGGTPTAAEQAMLAATVTNAINEIVEGVPLRVTIRATDEPDDDGDALPFIAALETNTTGTGCSAIPVEDSDDDGVPETFPSVTPGTPVCWDVVPERNTFQMPATSPLIFKARLTVYGDGSPLDSRIVYFLVPPRIEGPGGPD